MKEYEILEIESTDKLTVISFKNYEDAIAFMKTALLIEVEFLSVDKRTEFTYVELDKKAFEKLSRGLWLKVADPVALGNLKL